MQQRALMWLVVLVVSTPVVPGAAGQEWPQWRGSNRDGVVTSFREPAIWPDALIQHWTVEVELGYATPLLVADGVRAGRDAPGRDFTQAHLVGVAVATGELLWRRPYTTPNDTTAQTPILYGDTVIETGRTNRITAFRVVRRDDGWTTEDVWHTDEVSLHMANGVVTDGVLFGLSHLNSGQYFGLDLEASQVLWRSVPRQAENAAIVRAGGTIFSLEDDAELIILRSSRTGFEPVKRYDVP